MKRMLTIGMRATAMAVVVSWAGMTTVRAADEAPQQVFHGTLVDAGCMERPACPVTAGTRAFGLELADGKLLDLDEAGTTFVSAALNGNKGGRALINGTADSIRPEAAVKGHLRGSKIMVDSLRVE
jgi:hypothetical protein